MQTASELEVQWLRERRDVLTGCETWQVPGGTRERWGVKPSSSPGLRGLWLSCLKLFQSEREREGGQGDRETGRGRGRGREGKREGGRGGTGRHGEKDRET